MVLVPYLSPAQFQLLEKQQVSGIDLSGNALIMVPNEILISRTGAPNNFRRAGVIKNVYRKNSSIVARVFLLKPLYETVTDLMDEIENRGGAVSQATVSQSMRQFGPRPRHRAQERTVATHTKPSVDSI